MQVSVIIPAYNAAPFIDMAVKSALEQAAVSEIIIVEDGSSDGTLQCCTNLQDKHSRVTLVRHPTRGNLGVSASRNLGLSCAKGDLVAFLDADDYFLPNRFDAELERFERNPDIDGIYGAVQASFWTDVGARRFRAAKMKALTTVSRPVPAEQLIWVLFGKSDNARGHIHLDALTVRRKLFESVGGFDPGLRYGEDTDLIIRMALKGKLVPGSITTPVAVRGVHDSNHITDTKAVNRAREAMWKKIHGWGVANGMPAELVAEARNRMLSWRTHSLGLVGGSAFLLSLPHKHPEIWASPELFRRAVFGVFGETLVSKALLRVRGVFGWSQ